MNCARNITTAFFSGGRAATTAPLYQWDYGQVLRISGLTLPAAFQVHFSNSPRSGTTTTSIGQDGQVTIPDVYLTKGLPVYAFIFLHNSEDDGETEYVITIPVNARPQPTDEEPTPEQQSEINQLIDALNNGVERSETAADSAEASATAATEAAEQTSADAATAAQKASEAATLAGNAAQSAQTAAQSAIDAAASATESAQSAADADTSADRAEQSATAAAASATAASGSASDSAASATAAEGFAGNASTAAGNASQAAQNASQSATAASGFATAAGQSATAAAGSATTAGNKASEAAQSATEAAASATTAGTAATNAQTAQTAAETAQTAAETAADDAETSAASVAGKTAQINQNTEDISLLKSQLELGTESRYGDFKPGYIVCPSAGSTATLTRTNSAEVKSAIIPCVPGETAVLNIIGGGTSSGGARAFMICDQNLTVLVRSAQGATYDHKSLVIPEGGAYLVVNNLINSQPNPSVMIGDYAFTHNSDLFTVDIPFPIAAFRANATITDAGNFVTGRPSAITVAMTLPEPVIVYADTGYTFRYFEPKSDGSFYFAQYQTKRFIPANTRFFTVLYVGREESQNVTLDDTVFFRILCSPDTAKYIENLFTTEFSAGELTYTTPTSVYVNTIARGSFDTTRNLRKATAPYRRTTDLIKATVPFLVQSGYSTNTNPGVYVHKINDDLTVSTVQIPTNTRAVFQPGNYIIEFYNSNTSSDTSINRYIRIMAVSEQAEITSFVSQLGSPSASGGCAAAFFDNNFNLWMIRHTAQTMFVRKTDNTYTEDIALGMTCGHANNMAFYDDMAWISDWYLPKIYRFEIDSEQFTATYVDTIDMPTDGINGYVQYIPISDSEIIAVTWDSPRDVFYVVRYVKERITGEYREQMRFPVTSITAIIQGFAYFDGYVFILCDDDNNNNVGVQIVNLATQDMVFIPSSYTAESESIVSIEYCKNLSSGNDLVNVVICYEQGQLYQLQFNSKFLP